MCKTVTVAKALAKGQQIVNYPIFAIFTLGASILIYYSNQKIIADKTLEIIVLGLFVTAWLWWSFTITKWKVWAFENVTDVHELEQEAIKGKLIWPRGSFWEKTEIWMPSDKIRWDAIKKHLDNY